MTKEKDVFKLNEFTGNYECNNKIIEFTDSDNRVGKFFKDGELIYEGELKKYVPHGEGKLLISSKVSFEGKFKNGKKHGKGKEFYANESIFMEGSWKDDQKNGKFMIYDANGELERITKYENNREIPCPSGTIRNSKTGNCIKVKRVKQKKNTDDYVKNQSTGLYEKGNITVEMIGKKKEGIIRVAGDLYYTGGLQNFKPNGHGTFFLNGNAHYVGKTKHGIHDGKGKYLKPDGTLSMEGTWKNGKLHGKVKFILDNGKTVIVPYKNDEIENCPDGKEINYKTGNCVKSKKSKTHKVKYIDNKTEKLYDTVVETFCKTPIQKSNWCTVEVNDNVIESLLFIIENSAKIRISGINNSSLTNEEKCKMILDKIKTFYKNTNSLNNEGMEKMEKRFTKGVDGINLRDVGAFAEMNKIWIFFHEEMNDNEERWILPPKSFYNYTPKQIFFVSFYEQGEKVYHYFHNLQPQKIPPALQPLMLNMNDLRLKYPHLKMMYPTKEQKKLNEIYNKTLSSLEKMSSILPTSAETADEEALLQHLKHFRIPENNNDSISYLLFQWLKSFCHQHKCWIFLYHNKNVEFAASTMDEPFEKVFFIYKHSNFETPIESWRENEFQICCRQGQTANKIIETYMRQCSFVVDDVHRTALHSRKKIIESSRKKKPRKKTTNFDKFRKKISMKKTRR
jgi:antitoxin component YwqK of YwqJK toxin-antitoxin module